jgi:hypothetical protein
MFASLRALLTGIVDYAGLFPPAKLPLDQAIRNYARYRQEADAWMLGRFVIPAARLGELALYHAELFASGSPFAFSVLGRGGATAPEFLGGLESDLRDIAAFRTRHGDRVAVEVLETRLPEDVNLQEIADRTEAAGLFLVCEASGREERLLDMLAQVQSYPAWREPGVGVGFKLRCGGPEASAFPSSEQIASLLNSCLDDQVPFKATAGLHHPLSHFDPVLKVRMHGFVNLFLAGILAQSLNLITKRIVQILEEDRPEHFSFDDEGASWRDEWVSTEEIGAARRDVMLSFGSCSFDEPREDLRSLGWL